MRVGYIYNHRLLFDSADDSYPFLGMSRLPLPRRLS